MKCLILGGAGFIGAHLSEALLGEGYQVRIFERPNVVQTSAVGADPRIEWVKGDFVNPADVSRAVSGCDMVVHLISTTLPQSSNDNPLYDIETNVLGSVKLLEAVLKGHVRKVIFISSGGTIYGTPREVPIKESHPTEPMCSYGIGKLTIEKYLSLFHSSHGLEYCVLRMSNLYGERQPVTTGQGAIAVFLNKALKKETIEIWGDGTVVRDFLYVQDAIRAILKALTYHGAPRVFNIGAGQGYSLNDVLATIETLVGGPVSRKYMPGRPFDVSVNVLDISLAAHCLNWKPERPFLEGLSRTWQWMQHRSRA